MVIGVCMHNFLRKKPHNFRKKLNCCTSHHNSPFFCKGCMCSCKYEVKGETAYWNFMSAKLSPLNSFRRVLFSAHSQYQVIMLKIIVVEVELFFSSYFFCFSCKTQTASKNCIENIYYVVCRIFFFVFSFIQACVVVLCVCAVLILYLFYLYFCLFDLYSCSFFYREQWKGYVPQYQPVFMDGWSPTIPDSNNLGAAVASEAQRRMQERIIQAQHEVSSFFFSFFLTLIFFLFKHLSVHIFVIK